jgi:hypothetical protein
MNLQYIFIFCIEQKPVVLPSLSARLDLHAPINKYV